MRVAGVIAGLIRRSKYLLCLMFLDPLVTVTSKTCRHEKRVLIVRLDAIGDFVLWLDAAKELVNAYQCQGYTVTVMANDTWADWFASFGYADAVWPVNRQKLQYDLAYRWKVLKQVRTNNYEVALQPTFSRELLTGDTMIRVTAALKRIGSQGDCANIRQWQKKISDRWYTTLVPASEAPLMELERNAEFMRGLGFSYYCARVASIPATLSLAEDLRPNQPYYIIFPGASWVGKQWPAENFAALLCAVYHHTGWLAVLCGGTSEWSLCDSIAAASGVTALNLAGKTSLAQLAELIRSACLLVGNDTSAIHIASAVGTASVCILGGGHYGRFMPYPSECGATAPRAVYTKMDCFGCNWRCSKLPLPIQATVPCIESITVDQVLKACLHIYDKATLEKKTTYRAKGENHESLHQKI